MTTDFFWTVLRHGFSQTMEASDSFGEIGTEVRISVEAFRDGVLDDEREEDRDLRSEPRVAYLVQQSSDLHLSEFRLGIDLATRKELAENDSVRVEVALFGVDAGGEDFGGRIDWRADVLGHAAPHVGAEGADAEIADLGDARGADEDVGRLEVPMDDGWGEAVVEIG